nr:CapA family protein [Clostridia bacterium]
MKKLLALLLVLCCLPFAALAEYQVITLTVTGDALLGSNEFVKPYDYSYDAYVEKYGYAYPLEKMQSLFANDDITMVNLEVSLNNYVTPQVGELLFRGKPEYAQILSLGSVEVANLANNHTDDYWGLGYDATKEALDAVGVKYCGSTHLGRDLCWFDFADGVRVGFIGIFPYYYEDHNWEVKMDFQRLKDAGCDVIICSLHAGIEKQYTHAEIQERLGRVFTEMGANIIVGHHPHVPHGMTVRDGVTQLYSLGNFTYGGADGVQESLYCIGSLVAQIDLHFDDGVYVGHQVTLYPIHISGTEPLSNYQPILVEGEAAQAIMDIVVNDSDIEINPYVDGEGAVQDFVPWPAE